MSRNYIPFLLCLGLSLSCGDGRHPVGTLLVGPSGGTVGLDDSSAMLKVPAGAVGSQTEVTIERPQEGTLPAGAVPGTLVKIGPQGLEFQKPVTLTVSYAGQDLPQKDTTWLRMIQLLAGGKLGSTLFVSHDAAATTLSAKIVKGGTYVLADLKLANATVSTEQKQIKDVDVLFVVDNSNSMAQEQQNLAANFPKFIDRLDQAGINYHVGVVSTDLGAGNYGLPSCEVAGGDGGKLWSNPSVAGCQPPSDPWIAKTGTTTNVPGGDVKGAFSCIAQIGTGGCGFENTLEAARRALDPALNVNPGFVRKDAALAVVMLTDEDDCSAEKSQLYDSSQSSLADPLGPLTSFRCFEFGVSCDINDREKPGPRKSCAPAYDWLYKVKDYETFFKGLKPPGRVMMAAIAGPDAPVEVGVDANNPTLKPSCQSANGMAVPAIRIKALMDSLGAFGHFNTGTDASGKPVSVDICSPDFSPALSHIGKLVTTKILTSWCLPYDPVDTNPLTSGLEPDCVVVGAKAGPIPACTAASTDACYSVEAGKCAQSSAVLRIENANPADLGDHIYAVCLVL
jgi:hypothetical protein